MSDRPSIWTRVRVWTKRLSLGIAALFIGWLLIILVGLIPVNNDFVETLGGVEIFVVSNPVHADIVLPLVTDSHNLREFFPDSCFPRDPRNPSHIAVGWGDTGFFVDTPTWGDLKISTAAAALLWSSPTCLHVHMTDINRFSEAKSVTISMQQYRELVYYILGSFKVDENGEFIQIEGACYGEADAFFEAKGSYHLFNTCNSWVGSGLRTAGVRAAIMTPLPGTPTWYLPDDKNE